jgi:hypothetical protein
MGGDLAPDRIGKVEICMRIERLSVQQSEYNLALATFLSIPY